MHSADARVPSGASHDDHALVLRSRRGSREAFAELVRRHQARVRGLLGAYLGGRAVVDDLAQDVFLAAFRYLDRYNGRDQFRVWVLGIARHRALMHLRTEIRRCASEPRAGRDQLAEWRLGFMEAEGEEPALHDRALQALTHCLGALPDRSSALISEHYIDGRSMADMARQRGKAEGTLRVTMFRIRQALRDCVRQRLMMQPENR